MASRPEPEWDDVQRSWLLALAEIEADVCSGCHQPLSESTEQDARGGDAHGYVADKPSRCFACTALSVAQEEQRETKHPHGLLYQVRATKK